MSKYNVSSIGLAPVPGLHGGTGVHTNRNWVVVPGSVPGSGKMQFTGAGAEVTSMLFQVDAAVVPKRLGVTIPSGIRDFTKAHIFFRPETAQGGYKRFGLSH
jgi:hypothetical protein